MRLFFDEKINSIGFNILDESEATHISKVLRLKQGEIIYITNGKGKLFEAEIIDTKPSKFTINVLSVEDKHQNHKHFLHIAIAPTKNMSRFEWFVEKAVELGVDRITPLLCRYSERKKIKIERLIVLLFRQ
jgi:16S rRNA (uracil1498-N3)-methyltransferase